MSISDKRGISSRNRSGFSPTLPICREKSRLSPRLKTLCAALVLAFPVGAGFMPALANPVDPTLINGQASFATSGINGSALTVTNTPGTIISWRSFSIGATETTHFAQQSAASSVMNRVTGGQVSSILGTLSSNGQVFLINPGGIIFGAGATIDVAGLVASTLNLSNANFLAGKMQFDAVPGAGNVSNAGNITTGSVDGGGKVYLIAPNVENTGVITSPSGEILLAAGHTVELVNSDNPGLRVEITAPAGSTNTGSANTNTATNVGQLIAKAGSLGLFGALVKNSGTVSANSAVTQGGKIVLKASQRVEAGGSITADGLSGGSVALIAQAAQASNPSAVPAPSVVIHTGVISANGASGAGGSVSLSGDNILSTAAISANGVTAGGSISLVARARALSTVGAQYSANAMQGVGGNILVSGGISNFTSGSYSARGAGGNGKGGAISLLGDDLTLLGVKADASGTNGGGTILVGGDLQGGNPNVPNSVTTSVNFSTTLTADALTLGDGGKVIVWSDQDTQFYGDISARGGAESGNGGFIEISGKETLTMGGFANAGAANGNPGTLLLDPKNIIIDASASTGLGVFQLLDPTPGAGDGFAQQVVVLPNDNVVATDPLNDFVALNAGAVYLFNGTSGALISTLTGSTANDQVGSNGVTVLSNGNYVVSSQAWNNGLATDAGAVTWGSGATGFIGGGGPVSAANSLVGTTAFDFVGDGVTALSNGNYVVSSPDWSIGGVTLAGAVTWGNGATGIVGAVTIGNSLHGTTVGNIVGIGGVTALSNGNYVVSSQNWDNGPASNVGAVTWGDGSTAGPRLVGPVTASNSLVGTTAGDLVGNGGVTALSNGNYVVSSQNWDNGPASNVGAVTWGDGSTAGPRLVGAVTASNSLVGTAASDQVGSDGITALNNGNYVVSSPFWDNLGVSNVGAATWGDGSTAGPRLVGAVTASNSLVGTTANDNVGIGGVTALSNGNYVVSSQNWDNLGAVNAGAATWGDGSTAGPRLVGAVTTGNSLHGTTASDQVGSSGVTALTNGNYVVSSQNWDNGVTTIQAGAATWGNGISGISGAVTTANSLHGTTANDQVGRDGATALSNGNYVVSSPFWNNGATTQVGAATWGDGSTAGPRLVGPVTASNSLVGTTANDNVGIGGVTALSNGNYVVGSLFWDNLGVSDIGAATWGDGSTAGPRLVGAVTTTNSLHGTTANDLVGDGVTALSNGNYVVSSQSWSNGAVLDVGAVTFGSGTTGVVGAVSATNSLVGTTANDNVGSGGIFGLSNGNFVVSSPDADNGAVLNAGLLHVVVPGSGAFSNPFTFADNAAGNSTITPSQITAITNTGTDVVLQASNDITLATASDIITNNTGGDGGALTFQAGRSILLNSNITTDNGAVTLVANERTANGVVDANRVAGAAVITMAPGTTINAGNGNISITLNDGAGLTNNSSGDITLANLTTSGHVLVRNVGPTAGSGITRADVNSLVTAASAAFFADGAVSGGKIGTAAAPIRVAVTNLNARSQSGGIFFESPQSITLGGSFFGSGAILAADGGSVEITAAGTITLDTFIDTFGNGAVSLTASGALSDIVLNDIIGGGSGAITLNAGNDLTLDGAFIQNFGTLSITVGNDLTLMNSANIVNFGTQSITVGNNVSLTGSNITWSGSSQSLTVGGNLLLTGTTASAEILAFGASNISVGGNVILTGGTVGGAIARIFGDPDVNLTVGGVIQMNANAASASIEADSPTSIYISFPNLTSGGFFVNGVENTVFDAITSSGFVAGGVPAILDTNLLITYGLTATATATNLGGLLADLVNTTLIPGDGAAGSSQSTITEPESEKKTEEQTAERVAEGEAGLSGEPLALPVCK